MSYPEPQGMTYPANHLELDAPLKVANWRPLVAWLLGIPHLIIANVLTNVGNVVAFVAWFAIVFTGRLPEGLAGVQCLAIRYNARAITYALWMRESYPAFDFTPSAADPGGDAARVDFVAVLENRNRLTVGFRFLWAIPACIYAFFVSIGVMVGVFVAFFAVLFTGAWPQGMRDFMVRAGRYFIRLAAYMFLLTDVYPPFRLD